MTFSATLPHPGFLASSGPQGHHQAPDGLPRLLPAYGASPLGLRAHVARHGPVPYRGGPGLLTGEVEAAGLTGRGGAAFPTHRKLRAVTEGGRAPVVIGNAAEGEPASAKDKTLLRLCPHLVLDGLQLAAEAVGSRLAGLYVHRDPRLRERLWAAIAERAATRADRAAVELIDAPPRFLAGEESALASRAAGGPALPSYKPPRTSQRGVAGRPTLVQNAETLAHLALIARYGAGWFRLEGTAGEPGSTLVTLHRADGDVAVLEVPLGIPLAELLGLHANGDGTASCTAGVVQAVLVGGYHGAWLPATAALRLPLANAALRPLGAAVGAGVVAALPAGRCGLAETARVARYLALESAGKCGPCFNGLPRIADALTDLAGPQPAPRNRSDLERWAALVEGRGACHHPDGTVRFIRSALLAFSAEIAHHERGQCNGTDRRPFLPLGGQPPLDAADWR